MYNTHTQDQGINRNYTVSMATDWPGMCSPHVHCMWGKLPVYHSINLCGTWCENLTLTYGTNDTSISDHTGATEHVQQGDMLHMCGSTLGLVLWHHTVAIVGLGGEHSAALALPLTVRKGAGGNSLVNGAVLGHSRECGERSKGLKTSSRLILTLVFDPG